jgi:hypothetical protein
MNANGRSDIIAAHTYPQHRCDHHGGRDIRVTVLDVTGLPGFVKNLDRSQHKLKDIVGRYHFPHT